MPTQSRDSIKVVCRIRPENKLELDGAYRRWVQYTDKEINVECQADKTSNFHGNHDFTFDRIFGPDSLQKDVFMEIGYPIVQGVLGGFSGTIFAYGQTGSGKTFTMEGPDHHDEVMKGMIPRMFQCLFQLIEEADEQIEFTVKVSFLEIYMEKIMDLLNPKKSNLVVRKDKVNGVFVKDATEVYVNNADEMLDVMQAGSQNRSIAATRMNARSSRSHSLFMCTVFQKDTKNDSTKLGKLYCIDLAGSEKTEKTNATGQTLEEAKMINKSLSALGNVINALTDTKKNKHIPYRDSKLTQILQESIGGNSLTCLIITCSLSAYNDRETLSTLRFGNRAKSIKNKPIANAQRSAKELLGELNKTNKKIEKLDEIIRSMQKELKSYFDSDLSEEEIEEIKKSLQSIACAKDIDVIYAMLKPDLDIETLEENKEDEEDGDTNVDETRDDTLSTSKVVTNDSEVKKDQTQDLNQDEEKTSEQNSNIHIQKIDPEDPTQKALIQENAMKVVKQHIEITKLKEEIEQVKKEKEELEEEISSRSIEIYEMNEKILLMEMNHANDRQDDLKTIQDLKSALEYNQKSSKLVYDFSKFKDSLERLKDDLEVLKLSDKFTQNQHKKHFEVTEEFLGDNLDKSGKEENLEDSNNSSKNLSSDKLVLDNIQKMIELINLIQDEIEEQSKNKGNYIRQNSHKKRGENETGNSTTIMQDIDIITRAVSENVEANDQDSFLNSMWSDPNISKFEENTVKYSVSASTLEEKEAEIRDLKQFIDAQKRMLNEVIQNNQILTTKNEQLKNEIDTKPDPEPNQTSEREKDGEQDEKYETIKKDYYKLEEHFKETNKAKDKLYKELVQTREKLDQHEKLVIENTAKISELEAQNASLEKTVRQGKLQIDQMMTGMPLQPINNLGGYIDYSSRTNFQENLEKSRGENTKAAPPSFFAKKVIKPIRGGGKKRQSNVFEMNPYGSNQQLNKEYNNYAMKSVRKGSGNEMKFYKPPPSINPFTPVIKPGDSPNEFSRKSIKQLQRENKKKNYMDDFLQAQRMIADESINNPDESINIDDKGSEYSSPERQEEMLSHLQSYPKQNLRPSHRHSLKSTPSMGSMGQSAAKPAEKTKDSENPFQPKKKKGLGSTLSKVWKGIF